MFFKIKNNINPTPVLNPGKSINSVSKNYAQSIALPIIELTYKVGEMKCELFTTLMLHFVTFSNANVTNALV